MRVIAIAIRGVGVIAMRVGRREWLVVGVPLLLVILRHAVLKGRARIVVSVLWIRVTSSSAAAAADVIATGWVVVISVGLLRVEALLRVVRQGLHVVAHPPRAVCAVRILLKDLAKVNRRKGVLMTAVSPHKQKKKHVKKILKLAGVRESDSLKSNL